MKILVTGDQGYIGSVLVQMLMDKGYKVVGYDAGFFAENILCKINENYERIKKDIGSACPPDDGDGKTMHVKGRDLITGLPKEITISQRQIAEALAEPVAQIIDTIKRALEQTPAELSADIVERGIMMTGGGSLLGNLDKVLRRATSLPISIADDPLLCVVIGTGKALEEKSKLSDVFATD